MISIIIPVYNVAQYLPKCIESLINQTYTKLQIILINDGSTDNSGAICDLFAKQDDRITVIHQENQGVSVARNQGLAVATGEYIGFVDPDDWCELNMYEVLFDHLIRERVDAVKCSFMTHNCNEKYVTPENAQREIVSGKQAIENICGMSISEKRYNPAVWNGLFKAKSIFYPTFLQFDTKISYGEDEKWLFSYLISSKKILFLEYCLYHYVQHKESVTSKTSIVNKMTAMRRRLNFLATNNFSPDLINITKEEIGILNVNLQIEHYLKSKSCDYKFVLKSLLKRKIFGRVNNLLALMIIFRLPPGLIVYTKDKVILWKRLIKS